MKDFAMRIAIAALCCTAVSAQAAVTISSKPTQNMNCASGVCTPTAKKASLNVTDLTNLLANGNVTVNTGTGSLARQVEDINISAAFSWSSASSLTLAAWRSLNIDQAVVVAGTGAVALSTNNGGSTGVLLFASTGSVSFSNTANSLTINGTAYTLENSVSALASAIGANPDGDYALANNYDASQEGTYQFSPIPTTLTGMAEGLGNTISNLSIDTSGNSIVGLFQEVGATGVVASFNLSNVQIRIGNHSRGGATLAGLSAGTLFNDSAAGAINAKSGGAGGLAGANTGSILRSSANVTVKSNAGAGGLVGGNEGTIANSYASGSVTAGQSNVGGLVEDNEGSITQSFATGAVVGGGSSDLSSGGLVGLNQDNGTIDNSYATGFVKGMNAGGLIGNDTVQSVVIQNSYAAGKIRPTQDGQGGGFGCGVSGQVVANAYWDTTTSKTNQGSCEGSFSDITGLTSQQLQSGLPSGFDSTIWAENPNINHGFPYLIANPPPKK